MKLKVQFDERKKRVNTHKKFYGLSWIFRVSGRYDRKGSRKTNAMIVVKNNKYCLL
jgi:hypothetical protein